MEVQFLPMNKKITVEPGTSLLTAALECSIDIDSVCGGNGTCGKCKMIVTKGNRKDYDDIEKNRLTKEESEKGMRLSCRMKIYDDCVAIIPKEIKKENIVRRERSSRISTIEQNPFNEYGVIIDIGTTTATACLFDLIKKSEIIRISKNNPQKVYGADVISRISYGNQSEMHLKTLNQLILDCCNQLIDELLMESRIFDENNIKADKDMKTAGRDILYHQIKKLVILGNTTMREIFLGRSIKGLAKVPFTGVDYDICIFSGKEKKFHISPEGEVIVLPGIHGHVGSDTLGCILAVNLDRQKGTSLLIDIGTNGEIVLSRDGKMICTSTAAGPAFEGASIYQGMKASKGAIRGVHIDHYNVTLDVIGEISPTGICGSGVIDAIAELVRAGIVDRTGRILPADEVKNPLAARITSDNGMRFILADSEKGCNIVLTQQDIREVQLAKAAIYAGIISLLKAAGIGMKDIDNLYVAGAFGSNININNTIALGLLPEIDIERIKFIGNGAIKGGIKLLSGEYTIAETLLCKKIKHIELANDSEFQKRYINAINF